MTRWFDRSFSFAFDASAHPYIRARLRGTPARLDELTQHLPKDVLTAHWLSAWSIQENVGHLLDVEPLWAARLDNFLDGSRTLEPADLTNRQTHEARHDDESINLLPGDFERRGWP